MTRIRRWIAFLFFLLVSATTYLSYDFLSQPAFNQTSVIRVSKGMSANQLIRQLTAKLNQPVAMQLLVKLSPLATKIQSGMYQLNTSDRPLTFLYRLTNGDVLKRHFTFVDGTRTEDIIKQLSELPYTKQYGQLHDRWKAYLRAKNKSFEGQLLAETYEYNVGDDPILLLIRSHSALNETLEGIWKNRSPRLPYKRKDALLISSSIIEKETADPDERFLISSVIVNRLKKNMRLQMDPTVIYGLRGQLQGQLAHKDLQQDTPYNTYLHRGLPPTPISIVGIAALTAAAHPTESNKLYFVTKGKGLHHFSETLDGQRKAIKRYHKK